MAKSVKSYYYLINGNEVESRTLYVPYKDSYIKGTEDISEMDIATIDLGTSIVDKIKEANPSVELSKYYYLGKYPYARGIKMFKPIAILKETEASIKIVNGFREIAEERLYNSRKKPKSLEPEDKTKSFALIDDILKQISSAKKRVIFSKSSIIGKKIKENYFNNNYLFNQQMSNYTQLRNLLINYLYLIANRDIPNQGKLFSMSESLDGMQGLEYESPEDIARLLKEYKETITKESNKEEKEQVISKIKTEIEEAGQLNIFDMFGIERPEDESNNNENRRIRKNS